MRFTSDKALTFQRAIKADKLGSIIFYGPPGTGKTTLAKVIAGTTSSKFCQLNATVAGKKDMQAIVKEAKDLRGMYDKKTILFVDEIHRFNKSQQDYLLPFVEDGTLTLIGATTENPYFEVNKALISRSNIFELKPLSRENILKLIDRALTDKERGMGIYNAKMPNDARNFLADISGGDARMALNALELGILTTDKDETGNIVLSLEVMESCLQRRTVRYDKDGDQHYDTISAFIKSMRGSDVDGAIYYLARMLYAGEDISFIARRIVISASEDVGMADPMALVVAESASRSVERIGMPEARIILAEAVTYIAMAPKSNSCYRAIDMALDSVKREHAKIPPHLQDSHYKGSASLGHGTGYLYPHDFKNHYVKQNYLPEEIKDEVFYIPTTLGYEGQAANRLRKIKGEDDEI